MALRINQHQFRVNVLRNRLLIVNLFMNALLCLMALALGGCSSDFRTFKDDKEKSQSDSPYSTSFFGLPDLTTFDIFTDSENIHLLIGGKVSLENKQIELRYLKSKDGGNSWSKPITVAKPTAIINNRGNDIQLAAHGDHILALWQTKGELPGMGPLASAYSLNGGKTWINGKNPAINDAGDQSHADVIADKNGALHAVWLEDPEENGYQSLRYASSGDHGAKWSKPLTIEDSTCSCCWNTLNLSPDNAISVFYRDMKPRDMALMRSSDNGGTWQRISTVGAFGWQFDGCPHVGGALAYGSDNPARLHALSWTGLEGKSGLYFLTSDDNGQHWSKPIMIGKQAAHGDIAAINGKVFAIWDETENDGTNIYYAASGNGGKSWSSATKLSTENASATHPRFAATTRGLLALWTEKSDNNLNQVHWRFIQP